ncbi:hypothetical protein DFQ28_010042 [Apophysomyces sp. BC1034]|nr:hypothetical protein DFQ30_010579 [Apophysomyces sp. BC1015]KAG0192161.1 hypothetical protein DFQ28_010042 [Apophysomyces sp. BC1034]
MCLIVFDWRPDAHDDGAALLTLIGNRDEYFRRGTQPLALWPHASHVVAGRDLAGGGTWLGITLDGRFAALTNYRAPHAIRPNAPSRGALVSDFLTGARRATSDYVEQIAPRAAAYNGFNLLVGDWTRRELVWFSNRDPSSPLRLEPGLYGLSNALLDTRWPKVERKKAHLRRCLETIESIARHRTLCVDPDVVVHALADPVLTPLIEMMRDTRVATDSELPSTGLSLERERALSAAFIETADYGSRSTTAVRVGMDGTVAVAELSDDDGSHRVRRPGDVWRSTLFKL